MALVTNDQPPDESKGIKSLSDALDRAVYENAWGVVQRDGSIEFDVVMWINNERGK